MVTFGVTVCKPIAQSAAGCLRHFTCSHVAVDFEGLGTRGLHLENAAALLPGQEELVAILRELCGEGNP